MEWGLNIIAIVLAFIPVCAVISFIWFTHNFDSGNHIMQEMSKPIQPKTKFVKSYFDRSNSPYGGRVTALTAKPLLNIFYPELTEIHQPLSGQIATYKEVLQNLYYPVDYGVEISHLIDIYSAFGIDAIEQVFLGKVTHRNRNLGSLIPTAESVTNIIIDKAYRQGKLH